MVRGEVRRLAAELEQQRRGGADMQVAAGAGAGGLGMELEGQRADATWASLSDELEGQKVLASRWNLWISEQKQFLALTRSRTATPWGDPCILT